MQPAHGLVHGVQDRGAVLSEQVAVDVLGGLNLAVTQSQDLIRRTILKELDRPGGVNIGLIDQVVRYSLDQGYHAVLDGILYADRYEQMLAGLYSLRTRR